MHKVFREIKDTKIINGNSECDYFNVKWVKLNLYKKTLYGMDIFRPSEIYDFFEKSDYINEGYYSYMKYLDYLIPRNNRYYINPVKFTCSCLGYKYKKKCTHLKKYEYLYNISIVLMNKLGYSESRDIINLIYL